MSGVHANFFKQTLPEHPDFVPGIAGDTAKRWKSIWSAGHGSALVEEIQPIGEIVQDLVGEYEQAVHRLR